MEKVPSNSFKNFTKSRTINGGRSLRFSRSEKSDSRPIAKLPSDASVAFASISVGTEMKIKNLQERFMCVRTALTLCSSGMRTVEDACPYNIFASIIDTV